MYKDLFRGKSVVDGEWVYGFFIGLNHGFFILPADGITSVTSKYKVEVYQDTVGWNTGIKEQPGEGDIFTGDVLRITLINSVSGKPIVTETRVVEYRNGMCGVEWGNDNGFVPLGQFAPGTQMEVVGNVWDNPELLEV